MTTMAPEASRAVMSMNPDSTKALRALVDDHQAFFELFDVLAKGRSHVPLKAYPLP
jgi:hypothetical protein